MSSGKAGHHKDWVAEMSEWQVKVNTQRGDHGEELVEEMESAPPSDPPWGNAGRRVPAMSFGVLYRARGFVSSVVSMRTDSHARRTQARSTGI